MNVKIRVPVPAICAEDLGAAHALLREVYEEEMRFPKSLVTLELVKLNLDHSDRVRANAAAIAAGEGLDVELLQLAALLHDVSKLDHREIWSGGIDTWHHHHRGASLAKKLILANLKLDSQVADTTARIIEAHSDVPFIRRYWEVVYHSSLPTPVTPEEFALRDADTIDLLWVGGMSKLVHIRQVPGSAFYKEDGGDIKKAIISARSSFLESISVLSTNTGRDLAVSRILTVESFFDVVVAVKDLWEFDQVYQRFLAEKCA